MTYGAFAYGTVAIGSSVVTACPPPPSCNLIVMQLLEQPTGHLDIDNLSRNIDNILTGPYNKNGNLDMFENI